jgi:hypothetical protein
LSTCHELRSAQVDFAKKHICSSFASTTRLTAAVTSVRNFITVVRVGPIVDDGGRFIAQVIDVLTEIAAELVYFVRDDARLGRDVPLTKAEDVVGVLLDACLLGTVDDGRSVALGSLIRVVRAVAVRSTANAFRVTIVVAATGIAGAAVSSSPATTNAAVVSAADAAITIGRITYLRESSVASCTDQSAVAVASGADAAIAVVGDAITITTATASAPLLLSLAISLSEGLLRHVPLGLLVLHVLEGCGLGENDAARAQ